jgi:hypothetical protein
MKSVTGEYRAAAVIAGVVLGSVTMFGQTPSVQEIVQKSVVANEADFKAAVHFNWTETDRNGKGAKTSRVDMIEGTPYYRLIAVNGKPLSPAQEAEQQRKEQQVIAQREAESPEQRRERIEKFEKERRRDNAMMEQITKGFNFSLIGVRKIHGYSVYALKATPRPGYKPPNMELQVLTGMHASYGSNRSLSTG